MHIDSQKWVNSNMSQEKNAAALNKANAAVKHREIIRGTPGAQIAVI